MHVPPPPCESFQYLLTLRILEGFDLAKMPRNGVEHIDTVLRAIRIAAGVRIRTGTPSKQKLAELLSDSHVEGLRARVRDKKPITGPTEQWTPDVAEGHTTSFSIGDAEGNMVCVTQSLGSVFGSGVVVPGTGICCNNFLYWADVNPKSPNRAKIGEIMPVCVAPSIVTQDGEPVLALGTPGSYGILQTQPQAFVQYVDYAMPLQQAIEAPRARLNDGRAVLLESRVDAKVHAELRERGHDLTSGPDWTMKVGGMQGVAIDPADPRLHRRLRSAARRLRGAGFAYLSGEDGCEISEIASPRCSASVARGSAAISPNDTMPTRFLPRSSTASRLICSASMRFSAASTSSSSKT